MLKFMDDTGRAPDRAARTAEGRNAHRGALPPPVAVPGAIGQIHIHNPALLCNASARPCSPVGTCGGGQGPSLPVLFNSSLA